MTAYEIANIIYNLSLDENYMEYKDQWETEIRAIEEEIFKLKYNKSILYYVLESIANTCKQHFNSHTKEEESEE